jgi:hypothetical protein
LNGPPKNQEAQQGRDISTYAEPYLQGRMNLDDFGFEKNLAAREGNDGYAALRDGSLARARRRHFVLNA